SGNPEERRAHLERRRSPGDERAPLAGGREAAVDGRVRADLARRGGGRRLLARRADGRGVHDPWRTRPPGLPGGHPVPRSPQIVAALLILPAPAVTGGQAAPKPSAAPAASAAPTTPPAAPQATLKAKDATDGALPLTVDADKMERFGK